MEEEITDEKLEELLNQHEKRLEAIEETLKNIRDKI
jgi:ABC-type Fe3+-hydroxamate transport system substrate-binding protein